MNGGGNRSTRRGGLDKRKLGPAVYSRAGRTQNEVHPQRVVGSAAPIRWQGGRGSAEFPHRRPARPLAFSPGLGANEFNFARSHRARGGTGRRGRATPFLVLLRLIHYRSGRERLVSGGDQA